MPALLQRFLNRSLRQGSVAANLSLEPFLDAGPQQRAAWDRSVVLSVARTIDSDACRAMCWFTEDPICELGDKTARQLVEEGATARVLDMLVAIRDGRRDG
jgi:hypothetical protein